MTTNEKKRGRPPKKQTESTEPKGNARFYLSFDDGAKIHETEADTFFDAFQALKTKIAIKSKGVLTVATTDGRKAQIVLYPAPLRRLFVNKLSQKLFEKRISLMLK